MATFTEIAALIRDESSRAAVPKESLDRVNALYEDIAWGELAAAGFAKTGDYCFIYSYPPVRTLGDLPTDDIFTSSPWSPASDEINLYLHIPYCTGICSYCYFAKVVDSAHAPVGKDDYVELLIWELSDKLARYRPGAAIKTVYFGGGTPSTLERRQIERLMRFLHANGLAPDAEVSFECSPETIADDLDKLKTLRAEGVTRINLGVENLDDYVLRLMARRHTAMDTLRAYENLRKAGFDNVAMDVIYAIPGQSLESWMRTIQRIIELGPQSVSCYRLRTHPMKAISRLDADSYPAYEEGLRMQLAHGMLLTDAGYVRVSSQKYAQREERIYQQAERKRGITDNQLLAAGCGAYGFLNSTFYWNTKSLRDYAAAVREHRHPTWIGRRLDREETMRKSMVLGVHTKAGIDLTAFRRHYGEDAWKMFAAEIEPATELGLLKEDGDRLVPTELGHFFADELSVHFYSPFVRDKLASLDMKYGMFWERDRYA